MITTRLGGRLGNQMFQYAIARALSIRHGFDFAMDVSSLDFPYALHPFNIIEKFADPFPEIIRRRNWIAYDPEQLAGKDNISFDGVWQSYCYFEDCKDTIKSDFTLRDPLSPNTVKMSTIMQQHPESVCLSIRRGDFAKWPQIFPILTEKFYRDAVGRIPNAHFFIFSDEPKWAKDNVHYTPSDHTTFVDLNEEGSGYKTGREHEDLYLMSLCKHSIMANSSFSWWGSYLRKNPGMTFYPRPWFSDKRIQAETTTLFLPEWVAVDSAEPGRSLRWTARR